MITMRLWGSILALSGVILGAFASHALKEKLSFESFTARVLFVSTPVTRGANDAAVAS